MASLETIWNNPETWVPYEFGIAVYWGSNYDLSLELHHNWNNRDSNVALRFPCNSWIWLTQNTYAALVKLKWVIEWKKIDFEEKEFLEKVMVKNLEWELSVGFVQDTVVINVHQLMDNWWNRPCNRSASITFIKEWHETSDDLTITVNKRVFNCLAYLQHEMRKDYNAENHRYKSF